MLGPGPLDGFRMSRAKLGEVKPRSYLFAPIPNLSETGSEFHFIVDGRSGAVAVIFINRILNYGMVRLTNG